MIDDYMKSNQVHWDELVGVHARSEDYDLEGFKSGKRRLHSIERAELADVAGKSLLHLQCHFGLDTLSWASLGAKVTGIDFSSEAIELARSLSKELGIAAEFVCSNIYDLPSALAGEFDIVFTSYGAICWLPDLRPWGEIIARFLKPGGTFYMVEGHPFMWVFDDHSPDLSVRYPYSSAPSEAIKDETQGSYADESAILTHPTSYGWNHSMGDILNVLTTPGLHIEFLHEFNFSAWKCFPDMEEIEGGYFRLKDPEKARIVPLLFSLKATKR
ncbi:MAG: class I SAM-dependent methyltransferase [Chloroflexota bacterium]|nr:class I SAM-dependent methyltransferase [Chloroflexota bacterium]